jgi:hypothetical protein
MQIIDNQVVVLSSNNGSAVFDIRPFTVGSDTQSVTPVLQAIDVQFANEDDHNFGRLLVSVSSDYTGSGVTMVNVRTDFALRDWSGGDNDVNGDDPISASIKYAVIIT